MTVFWIFMGMGATLTALALAYRLGHTVGYKQAEKITLPYFQVEMVEQFTPLTTDADVEAAPLEEEEQVVLTA